MHSLFITVHKQKKKKYVSILVKCNLASAPIEFGNHGNPSLNMVKGGWFTKRL